MKVLKLAVLLGAAAMIVPAQAVPYYFTYADFGGVDGAADWTLTFAIDSGQGPNYYDPVNYGFPYAEYFDVIDGTRTDLFTNESDVRQLQISFFTPDGGGGFQENAFGFSTYGPAVFAGPVDSPVFQLGTFYFTDWTTQYIIGGLTISTDPNAAIPHYPAEQQGSVPEPANWALMVAGFGLAGAAIRRRSLRGSFG